MEKLQLKGNVILWIINKQKWLFSYEEITQAYLDGVHPFTKRHLSTATLNKILFILQKIGGEWWVAKLKKLKNYHCTTIRELSGIKDTAKKLGSGRYGTVYLYKGNAVKIIKHGYYKELPKTDGVLEYKILRLLQQRITFAYASPGIVNIYQFLPGKQIDYLVLEKLGETFWGFLRRSPSKRNVKGIILQVLFALLVVQSVIPGFRHNDLKVDNILLDTTLRKEKLTLHYKNYYWNLPMAVPIAKIADFDYAHAPRLVSNPKVGTSYSKTFGATKESSSIYDVHLFLNSLYTYRENLDPEIVTWLKKQLPVVTRGNETVHVKYGRLKNAASWEKKIRKPLALLGGAFFAEFRTARGTYPMWGV